VRRLAAVAPLVSDVACSCAARDRLSPPWTQPWHFDFLCRYRPLPEAVYADAARTTPLMQTRFVPLGDEAPPLDRLLEHTDSAVHERIAAALWEATSDADAVSSLNALAVSEHVRRPSAADTPHEVAELANVPDSERASGSGAGDAPKKQRRTRARAPQRTEEDIRVLRAERAAKRERLGTPAHVEGARGSAHS
jgi:hypothetical protein